MKLFEIHFEMLVMAEDEADAKKKARKTLSDIGAFIDLIALPAEEGKYEYH